MDADSKEGTVLYVWGRGGDAQLGHGDLQDKNLPQEVEALGGVTAVKVAAGGKHCLAITSMNTLRKILTAKDQEMFTAGDGTGVAN